MRNDRANLIVKKTFDFAVKISVFCAKLTDERHYRLSGQLFGCGTSIGANVREAQNAESKADFIHKMNLAAKEADETIYFLEICRASPVLPENPELLLEAQSLIKILSKIISTSKMKT